jgi:hypothetical protein
MEYKTADKINIDKETHKKYGCDYTPRDIAIKMAEKLEWDGKGNILEPCVGSGNLLIALREVYGPISKYKYPLKWIDNHFYGVDILQENITYCKNNFPDAHFKKGNCLEEDITSEEWWFPENFEEKSTYNMSAMGNPNISIKTRKRK